MLPMRGDQRVGKNCSNGDFATNKGAARGRTLANDIMGDMYLLGDTSEK